MAAGASRRRALLSEQPLALDNKVWRALGLLRSARLIETEETLVALSHVRLGVNLKRVKDLDINKVNELFLLTQPAHLQKIQGRKLEGDVRRAARADMRCRPTSPPSTSSTFATKTSTGVRPTSAGLPGTRMLCMGRCRTALPC